MQLGAGGANKKVCSWSGSAVRLRASVRTCARLPYQYEEIIDEVRKYAQRHLKCTVALIIHCTWLYLKVIELPRSYKVSWPPQCTCKAWKANACALRERYILRYWRFDSAWNHFQNFHREWKLLPLIGKMDLNRRIPELRRRGLFSADFSFGTPGVRNFKLFVTYRAC